MTLCIGVIPHLNKSGVIWNVICACATIAWRGELAPNCFHSVWWCAWKWCVDGLNVTQTERRALKEYINILDCVWRERSGTQQCLREHAHIVYVCGAGRRACGRDERVHVCKCWWACPCNTGLIDFLTLGNRLHVTHRHPRTRTHTLTKTHTAYLIYWPPTTTLCSSASSGESNISAEISIITSACEKTPSKLQHGHL